MCSEESTNRISSLCQGTLLCTFLVFHCWYMSGHCTSLFCDLGCDKSLVSISLGFPLPRSVFIIPVFIIFILYICWDSHYPSPETILSLSLVLVQWPRLPSVAL